MDDAALYNMQRWRRLVEANAVFTRPLRDMTKAEANQMLNADGALGDLSRKRVLALAGGGGRQSVLYGLCDADITILDLSDAQLNLDREMAALYGFPVRLIQGDMRDLSPFADAEFDLVDHPYSINFIPEIGGLFAQIARILQTGGIYQVMFANPFSMGVRMTEWNGTGYVVSQPYKQGQVITYADEDWVYDKSQFAVEPVIEYRHTLSTIIRKLADSGFFLQELRELGAYTMDDNAEGGTWEHLTATLPPWLWLRAVYLGDTPKQI